MLDNIEDPHNVGAILRSAEVHGFHHILLPHKGVPGVYPSVVKASAGASEHLQIARDMNATQYVKRLRAEEAWEVVALDAARPISVDEYEVEKDAKLLLVIGGENKSIHQFILNDADAIVNIRQHGRINSLNASVAAGIAMHALLS